MEPHDTSAGAGESHPSEHESQHTPTLSLTTSLIRIAASTAKAAGYKQTAKLITDWPELAGSKIGQLILKLRGKSDVGESITDADQNELENALAEEPQTAAQVLGIVVGGATGEIRSADSEKDQILRSYSVVLDTITSAMAASKTSFALSGFLHFDNCISYFQYTGSKPEFVRHIDRILPIGLDVYLQTIPPDPTNLQVLNEEIRRDPSRRLPTEFRNYTQDETVARLVRIEELTVTVERLQPLEGPPPNPFSEPKPRMTIQTTYYIPFGAPSMVRLFESLFEAQRAQASALKALESTQSQIKSMRDMHK